MVRTRIAPSPTGFPHIGTIYQALFDFAFARKHLGKFIIRIEDTDRNRLVPGAEEKIYEALDWFGLTEDESPRKKNGKGPYRQSERLPIYKKHALELIEKKQAYYCFCTKERLKEVRTMMQAKRQIPMYDKHCRNLSEEKIQEETAAKKPWVIRLKVPENEKIRVIDGIRGKIDFDSNTIDDQVLLKSDGFPTYHLAVVVDDHLMEITHAVRGEEWISSFPKHVLLYRYFGWNMPAYFHTPLLRNPDKSKLSKRHGHTNVEWYQQQGFLPEAILNFLALLGWSHPEEKEIFSMKEFIRLADLKDLKPIAPTFDLPKLEWMNGEYIRNTENSKLKNQIFQFLQKKYPENTIEKTVPLIKERIKKLSDYLPLCLFFFGQPNKYDIDLSPKKEIFRHTTDALEKVQTWKADAIGAAMQETAKKIGVKNSEYFMVLRVAITGKKISPPLNESMEILGKEECVNRLKKF